MGYYTKYDLIVLTGEDYLIEEFRGKNEHAKYAFDDGGRCEEGIKWYDHEKDMRKFSKAHPKVLFELFGRGEEFGDFWKKYFQNGKCQHCPAKITYDEFDKKKLE